MELVLGAKTSYQLIKYHICLRIIWTFAFCILGHRRFLDECCTSLLRRCIHHCRHLTHRTLSLKRELDLLLLRICLAQSLLVYPFISIKIIGINTAECFKV